MNPKGIMLLGPNEWDDDFHPPSTPWLRDYLDPLPSAATPKEIRKALAIRIRRESEGEWEGIVMDSADKRKGEDDADFFSRLEGERNVQAYCFFVPSRAKILGTTFEAGMLRRDFRYGANPRIVLFVEDGILTESEEGIVTLNIKGKRTRYMESLLRVAEHVEAWRTLEDGFERAARRCRAMWQI